jgi:hypothetical protein
VQVIKTLKAWVVPYVNLSQRFEGAVEMAQLLASEPDPAMVAEVGREAQ